MSLWTQDQEDVEYRVGTSAFFSAAHSIIDVQSAITTLAITVTGELGAFAMIYVSKDEVYKFLAAGENVWIYASVAVFVMGFMTTLAAFRLMPFRFRRGTMSTAIWPVAVIAGIANIALFYALLTFQFR